MEKQLSYDDNINTYQKFSFDRKIGSNEIFSDITNMNQIINHQCDIITETNNNTENIYPQLEEILDDEKDHFIIKKKNKEIKNFKKYNLKKGFNKKFSKNKIKKSFKIYSHSSNKDISFDLLKNQSVEISTSEQSLGSKINLFYNQHLTEIDVAVEEMMGELYNNNNQRNQLPWLASYLLNKKQFYIFIFYYDML